MPRESSTLDSLIVGAIAIGVGWAAFTLCDWHSHQCDRCGYRWSHLGLFSGGDQLDHTCAGCGLLQWHRPDELRIADHTYEHQAIALPPGEDTP